ncbi:hypothetical protein PESP_a3231 [Pseudoalteromonas espejiana DSM 9414]|uniref:Lipoprotein n=1 Tax=Pseudoalteromonas espejiana TaxID=28107 RepID=A0A510Y171_9GAMM|nr:lipoprotein [Pseudoalteromonas espejiana]ASM51078.1 hypothetical protein PESP_a3231 [Pseudoalteromonas espejiana DSM 9414]GEK57072.1 hypothetical protein PES01_39170 [Pseudoalteromonas espejiana]
MKKILWLLLALIYLSGCDIQHSESKVLNKPNEVPGKAFWVGGLDGGVFALIDKSKNLEPNEYYGKIYYVSGDTAYIGKMILLPKNSGAIDYLNPKIYQGWDGNTLYLEGNKQLKVHQ